MWGSQTKRIVHSCPEDGEINTDLLYTANPMRTPILRMKKKTINIYDEDKN